jgi:hypothetical protein
MPGYDQDAWVTLQRYQDAPWPELVILWSEYNLHLARVFVAMPAATRERLRHPHNLDERAFRPVSVKEPVTLDYFMRDYVEHLKHHVAQITALAAASAS